MGGGDGAETALKQQADLEMITVYDEIPEDAVVEDLAIGTELPIHTVYDENGSEVLLVEVPFILNGDDIVVRMALREEMNDGVHRWYLDVPCRFGHENASGRESYLLKKPYYEDKEDYGSLKTQIKMHYGCSICSREDLQDNY
jgi:hypothetical protein